MREEVVHARLRRNRSGGHRVVAGDHNGADAHAAKLGKAFADAAFDDVLEVNDAKQFSVLGNGERRTAGLRDGVRDCIDLTHCLGIDCRLRRLRRGRRRIDVV